MNNLEGGFYYPQTENWKLQVLIFVMAIYSIKEPCLQNDLGSFLYLQL